MEKFNLNYLSKDELKYEILSRGEDSTFDNVEALRKQLRSILQVQPDVNNLIGKLALSTEFQTVEIKVDRFQLLIEQCDTQPSNLYIARMSALCTHLHLRISNISACMLGPNYFGKLDKLKVKLQELQSKFDEIKNQVSLPELNQYEEDLNKSIVEEENLVEQLTSPTKPNRPNLNHTSTPEGTNQETTIKPIEPTETNLNENPNMQNNMLNMPTNPNHTQIHTMPIYKLPNPVEGYLSKITECNGLELTPLLSFLRNAIISKNEANITDQHLYGIWPNHTKRPLSTKIVECKTVGFTMNKVGLLESIVETYVPVTLKEEDVPDQKEKELDLQVSLNTAINASTKTSNFKLMFDHEPSCALTNLWDSKSLLCSDLTMEEMKQSLNQSMRNSRNCVKFDRHWWRLSPKRAKHPFKLKSHVLIRTHYLSNEAKKFRKKG